MNKEKRRLLKNLYDIHVEDDVYSGLSYTEDEFRTIQSDYEYLAEKGYVTLTFMKLTLDDLTAVEITPKGIEYIKDVEDKQSIRRTTRSFLNLTEDLSKSEVEITTKDVESIVVFNSYLDAMKLNEYCGVNGLSMYAVYKGQTEFEYINEPSVLFLAGNLGKEHDREWFEDTLMPTMKDGFITVAANPVPGISCDKIV